LRPARRGRLAVLLLVALAGSGCGQQARPEPSVAARLSPDFVGVVAPEVLAQPPGPRRQALDAQHAAGVRLLRQTFDWSQIETRPGRFDFTAYDGLVADSARSGLRLLPVIFRAPAFSTARPVAGAKITPTTTLPPRRPNDIVPFVRALVGRYGPKGAFWRAHPNLPALPIRSWQVWNEPNLPAYWGGRPSARGYVALLKAAGAAIHAADPRAEVVSAGLPESRLGVPLLRYVREMYAAGARGSFDTLAIHPYATSVAAVLLAARSARQAAGAAGDRKVGLRITEVGWASGGPGSSFTVSAARQGQLAAGLLREAAAQARRLGLRGVVYYSWRDVPPYPGGKDFWGLHTGLVARDNSVKPALTAFAAAAKAVEPPRR
jgi:hypothetical protein